MSRITRNAFVQTMSGGDLDIHAESSETQQALHQAGISQADLEKIAGHDGRISGSGELHKLFDCIDKVDSNGSRFSIATTQIGEGGEEIATPSGELYQALFHELEKARLSQSPGTTHLIDADDVSGKGTRLESIANARHPATGAEHALAIRKLGEQGFTDIQIAANTPYFNQAEKPWAKMAYPKSPPEKDMAGNDVLRTYQGAGCAPCALAMADGALRNSRVKPTDIGEFAVLNHYSGKPGTAGTNTLGLGEAWARDHNLTFASLTQKSNHQNVDGLRDGIRGGGVAVISVGVDPETHKGHFTGTGHIMVVNGVAKDDRGKEWFFIVNPGRADQNESRFLKTDATVIQDQTMHHGAGQLRISREQLEKEMNYGFVLQKRNT